MRPDSSINTGLAILVLAIIAIFAAYFIVRVAARDHTSVTNTASERESADLQDAILKNQYPH